MLVMYFENVENKTLNFWSRNYFIHDRYFTILKILYYSKAVYKYTSRQSHLQDFFL